MAESPYKVTTVHRAFKLLELIASHPSGLGVSELAAQTGWPKSSVFNILSTLTDDGYLAKDPETSRFRMTVKLFSLGGAVVERMDIRQIARRALERLRDATEETVNLGTMDGPEAIYLDTIIGPGAIRVSTYPGMRLPIHRTALGKALVLDLSEEKIRDIISKTGMEASTAHTITDLGAYLEDLEATRERGYSIDDEEDEEGMRCVGAPVRDHRGRIAYAISVTALAARTPRDEVPSLAAQVVDTAKQISAQLGYQGTVVAGAD